LESAYTRKDDKGAAAGETLPFTNVTYSFVNTLDYIFFDKHRLEPTELLDIPTSFPQLNEEGYDGGHLLPSDVWPSDHLAIGARLSFSAPEREVK
jgi:mRNA deadenylase 3'-5' endonuclease subunit Ccr4